MFTKIIILSTLLTTLTLPAMAEDNIRQTTARQPTGVVSISGASTLDELTQSLARKAEDAGASDYRIISAGGKNKLNGTAVIY
ncbi:outer membrane protein [Klebsiella variicola]|uniref:Outer membrane protein n=1 Tax=Klebsiella variicola TaxID=244366 RepID=A0ABD7PE71_KLEVA|nr:MULTISPECIES: DUF1471 domain-containing protein [Enterobacteriaceae]SXF99589.1 outer membrane protein [Klebsiella variicola]